MSKKIIIAIIISINSVYCFSQSLMDANNNLIVTIDSLGKIYDAKGDMVGRFMANGDITNINNAKIGKIDGNYFRDVNNDIIGSVNSDNVVLDINNSILGTITSDLRVLDEANNQIGYSNYSLNKMKLATLYFFLFLF